VVVVTGWQVPRLEYFVKPSPVLVDICLRHLLMPRKNYARVGGPFAVIFEDGREVHFVEVLGSEWLFSFSGDMLGMHNRPNHHHGHAVNVTRPQKPIRYGNQAYSTYMKKPFTYSIGIYDIDRAKHMANDSHHPMV
jgi:hypothetical protein